MASSDLYKKLNPTVEIMNIQRNKITECIRYINDDISDLQLNCNHISEMLSQLEQLCQLHFMFEVQLLEEINYPAIAEQRMLFDALLKSIESIKLNNDQCHTPAFFNDFNNFRLDFIFNMNNETRVLCDFISNGFRENSAAGSHEH